MWYAQPELPITAVIATDLCHDRWLPWWSVGLFIGSLEKTRGPESLSRMMGGLDCTYLVSGCFKFCWLSLETFSERDCTTAAQTLWLAKERDKVIYWAARATLKGVPWQSSCLLFEARKKTTGHCRKKTTKRNVCDWLQIVAKIDNRAIYWWACLVTSTHTSDLSRQCNNRKMYKQTSQFSLLSVSLFSPIWWIAPAKGKQIFCREEKKLI